MKRPKTLFIVRGLPNSGKSTVGETIAGAQSYAADDYVESIAKANGTTYAEEWTPERQRKGHELCQDGVRGAMAAGNPVIAVCNTFTKRWEMKPYINAAVRYGYTVHVITCERNQTMIRADNGHAVPSDAIAAMASRWEHVDARRGGEE